ncbi:hypothetical protein RvY_00700 [Ramazzottius varieornatus]|uniref:Uncharacterized protein n=1 Tax=Ramazzottius varieornatus TaxID=947166 RepID=A0A1D1UDP3_RAMVA|nr:hypothetical protein RvY_00700 [Ramazzottius varieornatus]
MEDRAAMSSEDLSAFYETLLTEFPSIEFIVDAFADHDQCGDHYLRHLEELGRCQFYRSRKVVNGMPGNRCVFLNPRTQVSKLVEDVLYAGSAGQKIILGSDAGLAWETSTEYQIALGIGADYFVAEGCSTQRQLNKLDEIIACETKT